MSSLGRNDPCFCGSGTKHKRCCLDAATAALRLAHDLDERILDLGEQVRSVAMPAWREEFERRVGPLSRMGTVMAAEAAWFDTWLVTHVRVVDGETPLEAWGTEDRVDAALASGIISGWWSRGGELPLRATPSHAEEEVFLHAHHDAFGDLRPGALGVARTAPAGGGHHALVGRAVVVDDDAVDDVLELLASTPDEALLAALRWPEHREHTAEGDQVQQHFRRYELADPTAALRALRAHAPAVEADLMTYWEDDVCFRITEPSLGAPGPPAPERGIVWELCDEDSRDPRELGEVTVSPEEHELAATAPSARRLELLVAALPPAVRAALGDVSSEDVDLPDVLPRVRRERLESFA